jgi:hypothetical protein
MIQELAIRPEQIGQAEAARCIPVGHERVRQAADIGKTRLKREVCVGAAAET